MTTTDLDDRDLRRAQGNYAFEQMAAAAAIGAAASGLIVLVYRTASLLVARRVSGDEVLAALFSSASFAALAFLVCFGAASTVGASLFVALERAHIRAAWPYFVAATMLSFAAAHFLFGATPSIEQPQNLALLLPGLIATTIFAARMRAYWRLAQRYDAMSPPHSLH
jgi:hypothetical protein